MSDGFDWWRAAMAGKKPEIHEDRPQNGFFKMRDMKDGPWLPAIIFTGKTGAQVATVGFGQDRKMRDPLDIWTRCSKTPVSQADCRHAVENGEWPGDAPTMGHNAADVGPLELLQDYIVTAAEWFAKVGAIDNQRRVDQAANYSAELLRLKGDADRERDGQIRPHLEAQREINGTYKPIIEEADSLAKRIKRASDDFLRAEKQRLEAEARKRFEAERKAAEAERARIEAEREAKMRVDPIAAMTEPEPELPIIPQAPEAVKVQAGGQRGKKMSLRTYTIYEITDYAAALAWAKDSEDVRAAVEKVCKAAAKSGVTVPGVTISKEERAA